MIYESEYKGVKYIDATIDGLATKLKAAGASNLVMTEKPPVKPTGSVPATLVEYIEKP